MRHSEKQLEENKDSAQQEDSDNSLRDSIIRKYYKFVELDNLLIILKEYGLILTKSTLISIISNIRIESTTKREMLSKSKFRAFIANQLYNNAKARAKSKNLDCTITIEWIVKKLKKIKDKCQATNIKFSKEPHSPYSPSLDRIEPTLGYTKANTQIVIINYNKMKSNHSGIIATKIAKALVKVSKSR
jgi:hypothetical protein